MSGRTILVTGAGGLLGREVAAAARAGGWSVEAPDHAGLDVTDDAAVRRTVERLGPAAVVHCAAMTDVDACEADPQRAFAVNATGSMHMARAAASVDAEIVAISTDYVFDGTKPSGYREDDDPNPVQEYGRSKLAGEQQVRESNPRHYVVRSAWIYGLGGKNFISRLPDLASQHGSLKVVADQTGSPTYAPDLARAILRLLESRTYGTYHVTNAGACSFAELSRAVLGAAAISAELQEVSWRDLGLAAPRPANTTLHNLRWASAGLDPLRGWRDAASAFAQTWKDREPRP